MTIKKVGVVGSGAMGTGIAQITAQYGYEVVVYDLKEEIVEKSLERIEKVLSKLVVKEKIYEKQKEEILERITTTTNLEDMKDVDLVIEAVVENMDVKQDVFSNLDKI
ncbi:MAG: 3-hydroxyacyl-CoA dehydrogenase NAD-binding domain-containing protein, partial [Bacillota bacterium]|nr:3-hydroxyacyl-CoA dehydrogenase NAD-binding domain-containing protein [Bacillota bacterium]